MSEIKDLKGKVLIDIKVDNDAQEITFTTNDGEKFKMYHEQDCCEDVYIDDVNGDINDLLNTPILIAEEVNSEEFQKNFEESFKLEEGKENYRRNYINEKGYSKPDSWTWTFYKLATIKGYVDIRWYGESNGYYSESIDFEKADSEGNFPRR
jgi:hypothetical protein